jgi:hypothetical protein
MGSFKGLTGTFASGIGLFALAALCAMFAMLRIRHKWRVSRGRGAISKWLFREITN